MHPPARPVRIGVLLWTERTSWANLRAAAELADNAANVDSIWLSDHIFAATGPDTDPCFEVWTSLAALAAVTRNATLGPLVGAVGLRNPGITAKMAATLDHISGGRSILGLGSGWSVREFTAHGIPWETSAAARIARLDEAAGIIQRLLAGETVSHHGRFYDLDEDSHAPQPLRERVPLLIGGEGRKHTLSVVARRADLWNARGSVAALFEHDRALREHCALVGRSSDEIERTTNRWITIRDDRGQAQRILTESLQRHGLTSYDEDIAAVGSLPEVAEQLAPTVAAGFRHIIASFREPFDMRSIEQLGELRRLLTQNASAEATAF